MKRIGTVNGIDVLYDAANMTVYIQNTNIRMYGASSIEKALEMAFRNLLNFVPDI